MSVKEEVKGTYRKTPIGFLPADWECLPFGEVFTRVNSSVDVKPDATYREIGIRSHGKGVFLKEEVKGTVIGEKRVFRCQPGTLCFNIVFAWEQAVAILGPECNGFIASHRFPMYKAKPLAHEQFYLWFFKSKRGKHGLTLASPGGAGRNKTLGQGELDFLYVPVPPLQEQRRIAQLLATWDQAIEQKERLITAKRHRKLALVNRLLTGTTRFKGFGRPIEKTTRPPELWKTCHLNDIANVMFSGVDKKSTLGETPVFLCNYTDVYSNEYITQDTRFMSATASRSEIERFGLKRGDVMITKDSETPHDIGVPAVVTDELENVLCGYHLALIRPDTTRVDSIFLAKQLSHERIRNGFTRKANGATRFGLSNATVQDVVVWLPPLEEQRRIASVLSCCDREISDLCRQCDALRVQKNGLMQQLLTGRIRVSESKGVRA